MKMNKYHQEILSHLEKYFTKPNEFGARYMGTKSPFLGVSVPNRRKIIKDFIKAHPAFTASELNDLLSSLSEKGKNHEELSIRGVLLESLPKLRKNLDQNLLDYWLNYSHGWGEVDCLCQSNYKADELLENWEVWEKLITKFVKDENIHKRRASLVLLTKPVGQSSDPRLSDLAFINIDWLKNEKDILITKAISWLMRSLIKNHRIELEEFINKNENSLPKIALRETKRKLATGKK